MPSDTRKERRRHLVYYLQIVHPNTGSQIGYLVDITTIGMMIISDTPQAVGEEKDYRILLPGRFNGVSSLDVKGEPVWCHKDINPLYYATGVRFHSLTLESITTIEDLVYNVGFHD